MKLNVWLACAALVATGIAVAQAPAAEAAARRPAIVRSPEVGDDGRVTFRLRAPKAVEVAVSGQWPGGTAPMTRDDEGLWSLTIGPVPAGVWEYSFQLDGVTMIDPGNPAVKPMREPRTSILHIAGKPPMVFDYQDVPHGALHAHTYPSKTLGRLREMVVYTPPGYDEYQTRYPTLYLQHGSGDNQQTWTTHGKAHWILDNLIAAGQATPMVVVMLDGHAGIPGTPGAANNTAWFERELLTEVLPWVERRYRVKRDPAQRAIAGLSMGGGQSLVIGLNHREMFGWVAGFSAAAPGAEAVRDALDHGADVNRRLRLLWMACGKDDFLLARNQDFLRALDQGGIRYEWHLTEGNHSWPIWRAYWADLAPRLFKSK